MANVSINDRDGNRARAQEMRKGANHTKKSRGGSSIKSNKREIDTSDKTELITMTFLNCGFVLKDVHQLIFQRCIDTVLGYSGQQLVKLRQVNIYFREQIDKFILEYIQNEYRPNTLKSFWFLGNDAEKPYFPPCLNLSLNIVLLLHLYAINHPQNEACQGYTQLFECHLKNWAVGCIEAKNFTYDIVEGSTECNLTVDGRSVKLNSDRPYEAYLIGKFLEEYIEHEQFLADCADEQKYDKVLNLLQLLNPYQSYSGMDTIMCSLVYKIQQYLKAKKLDMSLGLDLLGQLLEKNILTSQQNLNDLVPLGIENLNNADAQVQINALCLLNALVGKGIVILEKDLTTLVPFAIENLRNTQWQVQYVALTLLTTLISKDIVMPEKHLNTLQSWIIDNINCMNQNMQPSALVLLSRLASEEILWAKVSVNLLNSIYSIFKNNKDLLNIEILSPTFLLLNRHPDQEISKIAQDISLFLEELKK